MTRRNAERLAAYYRADGRPVEVEQMREPIGGTKTAAGRSGPGEPTGQYLVRLLDTGDVLVDDADALFAERNDSASTRFPECAECGARPGQAHDPACGVHD